MPGKIFINYRRDDALAAAGRLQDRLARAFGAKSLFMDVDHIPAGVDFVTYLSQQVAACDVFLAVMGPGWLEMRDDKGQRRIDNPEDFVVIEIAAALARGGIRVIPVLLDGARMPRADELPEALKLLARRNAVEVRNTQFGRDAEVLIGKISDALKAEKAARKRWSMVAGAAGMAMSAYVAAALLGAPVPWWFGSGGANIQQTEAKRIADAKSSAEAAAAKKKDDELVAYNRAAAERKRIADGIEAKAKADADAKRLADSAAAKKTEDERIAKVAAEAKQIAEVRAALDKASAFRAESARRLALQLEPEFEQLVQTGTANQLAGFALLNPTFAARADPVIARKKTAEEEAVRRSDPIAALKPGSGQSAQDCWQDGVTKRCGPMMVVVPAGSFMMGSPDSEERYQGYDGREGPQHSVTIKHAVAIGRFAVMRGELAAFVAQTGHKMEGCNIWDGSAWKLQPDKSWQDPGFPQTDQHPVVCVNWNDAKIYTAWLSRMSGKPYRLLSESEREYAARAGTTTSFWWGSTISTEQANYNGNTTYGKGPKGEFRKGTVPFGRFSANAWGLFDVHGNVSDWTEDCWHDNYHGTTPTDGSPWIAMGYDNDRRVLRGGSWGNLAQNLRSASRFGVATGNRSHSYGFRVARSLAP